MHWSGPENIAWVKIDGEGSRALLESGSTIKAMTLEFVKASFLGHVGPLSNLVGSNVKINGSGGLFLQALGYVIIRVQAEGVKGYNEDQVVLVIPDSTDFWNESPGYPRYPFHQANCECYQRRVKIDKLSISLSG